MLYLPLSLSHSPQVNRIVIVSSLVCALAVDDNAATDNVTVRPIMIAVFIMLVTPTFSSSDCSSSAKTPLPLLFLAPLTLQVCLIHQQLTLLLG